MGISDEGLYNGNVWLQQELERVKRHLRATNEDNRDLRAEVQRLNNQVKQFKHQEQPRTATPESSRAQQGRHDKHQDRRQPHDKNSPHQTSHRVDQTHHRDGHGNGTGTRTNIETRHNHDSIQRHQGNTKDKNLVRYRA